MVIILFNDLLIIFFLSVKKLFLEKKLLNKILLGLVAFSAGALLGGAFLHLLPEAIEGAGETDTLKIFLFLILGFITFFVLEHFIRWHHHHAKKHPEIMPFSYLVLVSDAVHNFIDGVVIAAAFVVAVPLGVVTTLAVILHEIPQEIGDFGILVYGGFKRTRALFLNFVSAVVAVIGGLAGFFLSEKIGEAIIFLLPFAAGNFIYIAASDLIPEIKQKASSRKSIIHFFIFLLGLSLMLSLKLI